MLGRIIDMVSGGLSWFSESPYRARSLRWLLWVGLLICAYAVYSSGQELLAAVVRLGPWRTALLLILLFLGWFVSVAAWRVYLSSMIGQWVDWRVALRQSAQLLLGKYLPGGIFGFAARLFDDSVANRAGHVVVGLIEQAVNLGALLCCGGVLFLAARLEDVLLCLLLLPIGFFAAFVSARTSNVLFARIHGHGNEKQLYFKDLVNACNLSVLQQIVGAILVGSLAYYLLDERPLVCMGVAGAFLISTGIGMIAVFAPGGIGVREATLVVLIGAWVDSHEGLALAVFLRVLSVVLDLSIGALVLGFSRLLWRR